MKGKVKNVRWERIEIESFSDHWKNYALNVINNFAGEVLAFAMQVSSVR